MDVTAIGELLIDFTPYGLSEQGNPLFERNPGGAPANVLAALAKLGRRTAFIGSVGEDAFGHYLREVLERCGIDVNHLAVTEKAQTTLAFVQLDSSGDRTFTFCRKPGADQLLCLEPGHLEVIRRSSIFHFGSLSMTHEPSRTSTLTSAAYAREQGLLLSYDPNLRLPLWDSEEQAKAAIARGMELADIVKLSGVELEFLTGIQDLEAGADLLMDRYPMRLLLITLGPEGSFCRVLSGEQRISARHAGFEVKVRDTTGAGDAFLGGILHRLLERGADSLKEDWTEEQLQRLLAFGNAMGALTATGKGAVPSLPTLEQVEILVGEKENMYYFPRVE